MSIRLPDIPPAAELTGGVAFAALALPDLSGVGTVLDLLKLLGGVLLVLLVPFGRAMSVRAYRASKAEIMDIHREWYQREFEGNAATRAALPHLERDLQEVKASVGELMEVTRDLASSTTALTEAAERMTVVMDRMDERDRANATKLGELSGQIELLRQTLKRG